MTTTDALPAIMWTSEAEIARSPFGVALEDGILGSLPLNWITEEINSIRGTGISVANDGRIVASVANRCYTGAKLGSSDSRITDSDLFNHRDTCLWIARDAGNCRSLGNQLYGARIPLYNEGGEGLQSTADRIEDGMIGTICDAKSKFVGGFFQQNLIRCAVLRGGSCVMDACEIRVQRNTREWDTFNVPGLPSYYGTAGVEIVGNGARVRNCQFTLDTYCHPANTVSGRAATGLIIAADDCTVEGTDIDDNAGMIEGSTAITISGQRNGLKIRSSHTGFHGPGERVLIANAPCQRLNVVLEIELRKRIKDYIDLVPGWTGKVQVVNKINGNVTTLPEGQAA